MGIHHNLGEMTRVTKKAKLYGRSTDHAMSADAEMYKFSWHAASFVGAPRGVCARESGREKVFFSRQLVLLLYY
jgi:hypothetical protein